MNFSAVLPQSMAGDTQHPFRRHGQKLGSSERDYMDVLQFTQVCSHETPFFINSLDAKRDIPG
jgi:hypothetical protein